jgi:hypothetical protein
LGVHLWAQAGEEAVLDEAASARAGVVRLKARQRLTCNQTMQG